jgi:hypothetical protein
LLGCCQRPETGSLLLNTLANRVPLAAPQVLFEPFGFVQQSAGDLRLKAGAATRDGHQEWATCQSCRRQSSGSCARREAGEGSARGRRGLNPSWQTVG